MKKLLSIVLTCLLLAACMIPAFAADKNLAETKRISDYPMLVLSGFSSSPLGWTDDEGDKHFVWKLNFDSLPEMILRDIANVALDAGVLATTGNAAPLIETAKKEILPYYLEKLKMNPDGTSVYNVDAYFNTIDELRLSAMWELDEGGNFIDEPEKSAMCAEEMGGYDHIYYLYPDWRKSILECAARLDRVIEEICEAEGTDKVNILAISHGGQTAAYYLADYGYKNRVNHIVFTVPAIGGAGIAYDPFLGTIDIQLEEFMPFIENGTKLEPDLEWLFRAKQSGLLNDLFAALLPTAMEYIGNWESLWDFIPADKYEEFRAKYNDDAHAKMIERCDRIQYEILPRMGEILNGVKAAGTSVNIMCGYGGRIVSGMPVTSDGIIPTYCASNATCAPYGMRFADGYQTLGTTCSDPSHDHLSPAMDVDASTCWLPENTYFIDGYYHGMEYKDPYTRELLYKLLFTNDLSDVHADPAFPQFHQSTNRMYGAALWFDKSADGYVSSKDTKLIIKNVSDEYPMEILSVIPQGLDLYFDLKGVGTLEPGESVEIPFSGKVPKVSRQRASITVTFNHSGNATPLSSRTVAFTIKNGAPVAFDENEPIVSRSMGSVLGVSDEARQSLKDAGVLELFELVYGVFGRFIQFVKKVAAVISLIIGA